MDARLDPTPLRLLESAPGPRTRVQSPLRWSEDPSWKRDYLDLTRLSPEIMAERRPGWDEVKAVARAERESA